MIERSGKPPAHQDVCDEHDSCVDGVSPLVKADGAGGLAKEARVTSRGVV